jgi:hypothetical protein
MPEANISSWIIILCVNVLPVDCFLLNISPQLIKLPTSSPNQCQKRLFNISATNFASSPDKVCGRVLTTYCNLALLALPTIVRVNGEIRIHEILGEKRVVTLTI